MWWALRFVWQGWTDCRPWARSTDSGRIWTVGREPAIWIQCLIATRENVKMKTTMHLSLSLSPKLFLHVTLYYVVFIKSHKSAYQWNKAEDVVLLIADGIGWEGRGLDAHRAIADSDGPRVERVTTREETATTAKIYRNKILRIFKSKRNSFYKEKKTLFHSLLHNSEE